MKDYKHKILQDDPIKVTGRSKLCCISKDSRKLLQFLKYGACKGPISVEKDSSAIVLRIYVHL